MAVQAGIVLALLCAFATNVGFLKHRGACAAPDVSLKHPVRSAAGLFRSKWFAVGMLVAAAAWGLHVAALVLAPLSVVQAVIAGGGRRRPPPPRRREIVPRLDDVSLDAPVAGRFGQPRAAGPPSAGPPIDELHRLP